MSFQVIKALGVPGAASGVSHLLPACEHVNSEPRKLDKQLGIRIKICNLKLTRVSFLAKMSDVWMMICSGTPSKFHRTTMIPYQMIPLPTMKKTPPPNRRPCHQG